MKLSLKKDLGPLRAAAIAKVNAEVERFRTTLVTAGSAQAMVYGQKQEELARFRADPDPQPERYPYIMIDAELYGISLENAARFLEYFAGEWEVAGPQTERVRRGAIVVIEAATTPEQIEKAAQLDWTPVFKTVANYHS